MSTRCFIGLGSNLDNPAAQIERAIEALAALPQCRMGRLSPRYGSHAIGPGEQPDYVNAVAELFTTLAPLELLDQLQAVENQQHRRRLRRWGPRTLDLDLLLYGDEQRDCERLSLPHPRITERAFVLVPLNDIAPNLQLPDGTSISSHLDYLGDYQLWPLPARQGDNT